MYILGLYWEHLLEQENFQLTHHMVTLEWSQCALRAYLMKSMLIFIENQTT